VTNQCVQTFNSGWHATGRDAIDFWNFKPKFVRGLIAIGNVRLVRVLVGSGKFLIFG
jgi:hypothetical protein